MCVVQMYKSVAQSVLKNIGKVCASASAKCNK
jgi:hypothetical protein